MNNMIHGDLVDLNDFKMLEEIGRGKYGIVYKCIRKPGKKNKTEKLCACKFFQNVVKPDKFIKEVQCQARLHHECILSLEGFCFPFFNKGDYAVITELMTNGSLRQVVENVSKSMAPPDWDFIRYKNIFGIAAGMAFMHQTNVIHRDLKTENIMLDKDFNPKIADFGFSKIFQEGTQNEIQQTVGIGTPAYMAPEAFDSEHYSNKVDVFSYAIILYELLTSKKPWGDDPKLTLYTLALKIKEGKRPNIVRNEIPEKYQELIEKCWDNNPEVRPSFIEIVNDMMENKNEYFDSSLIDELEEYMQKAIQKLNL